MKIIIMPVEELKFIFDSVLKEHNVSEIIIRDSGYDDKTSPPNCKWLLIYKQEELVVWNYLPDLMAEEIKSIESLKKQNVALTKDNIDCNNIIDEKNAIIQTRFEDIKHYQERIGEYNKKLDEKDIEIENLIKQRDFHKEKIDTKDNTISDLENKRKIDSNKIDDLKQNNYSCNKIIDYNDKTISTLKDDNKNLSLKIDEKTKDFDYRDRLIPEQRKEINKLAIEKHTLKNDNEKLENNLERIIVITEKRQEKIDKLTIEKRFILHGAGKQIIIGKEIITDYE